MEQLLFSLNATIPVFLVMVIGYVLQQLHVTNDSFVKTLNSFNYKITLPVLLFKDMSTADFYSVWDTGYVLFCGGGARGGGGGAGAVLPATFCK